MSFVIKGLGGRKKLEGVWEVSGAKNSALPALAMSVLFSDNFYLKNIPDIEDVFRMSECLEDLGFSFKKNKNNVEIIPQKKMSFEISKKNSYSMRSSVILTGPILARFGKVSFFAPGGCSIGDRAIDIFLDAYKKMGASITEKKNGKIEIETKNGKLKGAEIFLNKVSVTATESIILAAVLAKGRTTIKNCAMEPEVVVLCEYLKKIGVKIKGIGTTKISIDGLGNKKLKTKGKKFVNIPDRIETGSVLILAILCGKNILIKNIIPEHNEALFFSLKKSGAFFEIGKNFLKISAIKNKKTFREISVKTHEYPGFPTDLQSQIAVFMTQAGGESNIFETIFDGRLEALFGLKKMGAEINVQDLHKATIKGKTKLYGKKLVASDLRAGFSYIIAGALASEETKISHTYLIKRGYENVFNKLKKIGLDVEEK